MCHSGPHWRRREEEEDESVAPRKRVSSNVHFLRFPCLLRGEGVFFLPVKTIFCFPSAEFCYPLSRTCVLVTSGFRRFASWVCNPCWCPHARIANEERKILGEWMIDVLHKTKCQFVADRIFDCIKTFSSLVRDGSIRAVWGASASLVITFSQASVDGKSENEYRLSVCECVCVCVCAHVCWLWSSNKKNCVFCLLTREEIGRPLLLHSFFFSLRSLSSRAPKYTLERQSCFVYEKNWSKKFELCEMSFQRFALSAIQPTRWANGKGETKVIAIWPPSSSWDSFLFRISAATVASDGPFSTLMDIDRTIALLSGDGVAMVGTPPPPLQCAQVEEEEPRGAAGATKTLNLSTSWTHLLTRDALPFTFVGEDHVEGTLLRPLESGVNVAPSTDFNVMSRRSLGVTQWMKRLDLRRGLRHQNGGDGRPTVDDDAHVDVTCRQSHVTKEEDHHIILTRERDAAFLSCAVIVRDGAVTVNTDCNGDGSTNHFTAGEGFWWMPPRDDEMSSSVKTAAQAHVAIPTVLHVRLQDDVPEGNIAVVYVVCLSKRC